MAASLFHCFVMWWSFKNKKDKGQTKMTWKTYWKREVDDYLAAMIVPQFLVWIYPDAVKGVIYLYCLFVETVKVDANDFLNVTERFSAIVFGLFGPFIYTKLASKVIGKIKKI